MLVSCIFFIFNSFIFWQQNVRLTQFVSDLPIELPKGAFVMMYKGKAAAKQPVDALLHAVSYHCIFNNYVNVGNYETEFNYFPVHFLHTLPPFPSPEVIAYNPATIRWADYPSIQYVFGWDIDKADKSRLSGFYQLVWEDGSSSIWKRISLFSGVTGLRIKIHG